MRVAASVWKLDRLLLAVYLIALVGLLMFPIGGPEFGFFGIGIDKWMHMLLFGGLAVFVRWNVSNARNPVALSIAAAFVVAAATEAGQGLVSYRSMEMLDLFAGVLGATVGTLITNRILTSAVPEKTIGVLVLILGLMISTLFVLADVIGVGSSDFFGTTQMAGTALGLVIVAGGVAVYRRGPLRSTQGQEQQ